MRIPTIPATPVPLATNTAKSQQTSSTQETDDARTALTASFSAIKVGGSSNLARSQGVPGIDGGLLNAMVETSRRMQDIRNDPTIDSKTKEEMLRPLLKANKDTLNTVNAMAEQEEKAKILEASNEDAQTIREAGEEIAASLEEKNAESTSPAAPNAPTENSQAGAASQDSSVTSAPAPASNSAVYPASAAVGDSVDTHA